MSASNTPKAPVIYEVLVWADDRRNGIAIVADGDVSAELTRLIWHHRLALLEDDE